MKPLLSPALLLLLTAAAAPAAERLTFEQHVRPVLKAYCLDCHGAEEKPKGKLDLRLRRLLVAGGRKGPSVVPGKPTESLLLDRMRSGEMPPGEKKVPKEQIAVIERWIAAGAPVGRAEPASLPPGIDITPEERAYWFFQPVRRPVPPPAHPSVRTPVDAFLLTTMRSKNLAFNPDADRATLIRRVTLGLTGLPPTPDEVAVFVADARPDAYEQLVDRLLASPAYGERWARHWLDVAGYADSDGDGTNDTPRPHAWRYRDWVVRAFNADKPFDRFVTEQLAGDELAPRPWNNPRPEQVELLAATGFLRTAPDPTASGGGQAEAEQVVADTLKIVGSSLLGLTIGCAQCHDHRYDPIPHVDYFRLRAVFEPALDPAAWRRPPQRLVSLYTDADRAKAAAIEAEVAKMQADLTARQTKAVKAAFDVSLATFPAEQRAALRTAFDTPDGKRTPEQKKLVATNPKLNINPGVLYQYNQAVADELQKLQNAINTRRAQKPVEEFVAVLDETPGRVPVTRVHHRGDYRQPKGEVTPGDLTVLGTGGKRSDFAAKDPTLPTTGRRLALARHLTSGEHPLTARVLVNRLWLHHFGRGLVDSPGDFGTLGQRPSHPELLDWLASELVRTGWSVKQIHRLLVTSTAYRQSSRRTPAHDIDSSNTLLSRYPVRRLEAEAVRDRMLAATGRLDRRTGGPPLAGSEDAVGQVNAPDDQPRRSLYLQAKRTKPIAFLAAFDAPVGELCCDRRVSSTVAPQALMLMNSDFVLQQAGHLARRVLAETPAHFDRDRLHSASARFARPSDAWSYGFGEYDPTTRRVVGFNRLTHWTGSGWQAGPTLPDPRHGFVLLQDGGGHAGNDQKHATVRRWTAPRDGRVELTGKLHHPLAGGDGVRGRVVSSRGGLLGEWSVKSREVATNLPAFDVRAGDTIDIVVDCQANVTSDWFTWPVTLRLTSAGGAVQTWTAVGDFHGPRPALPQLVAFAWQLVYGRPVGDDELDLAGRFLTKQLATLSAAGTPDAEAAALTNLCQQLLASSEFLYVD